MDPLVAAGWNMRQPEIDALQVEVQALRRDAEASIRYCREANADLDNAQAEAGTCRSEAIDNKAQLLESQAEVERLRLLLVHALTEHDPVHGYPGQRDLAGGVNRACPNCVAARDVVRGTRR